MSQGPDERRRAQRSNVGVSVMLNEVGDDRGTAPTHLLNVSLSGVYITANPPPAVGTRLELQVMLADQPPMTAEVEVVRQSLDTTPVGVGARFVTISDELTTVINQMVALDFNSDDYVVDVLLAIGRKAEIYGGHTVSGETPGRNVAIKRLRADLGAEQFWSDLFQTEIAITRHLDHPNIVSHIDTVVDGPRQYLIMEYLDGCSLWHALQVREERDGVCMPVDRACFIAQRIARALHHLHELQVDGLGRMVHLNVAPANIVLTTTGEVKLIDFGLVHVGSHEKRGHPRALAGWAQYMAPELLLGGSINASTDVFAAGAMLFDMLTGQSAFPGEDAKSIAKGIIAGAPPPPSSLREGIAAELDEIVTRALSPWAPGGGIVRGIRKRLSGSPERYATAAEFADALSPFVRTETDYAEPIAREARRGLSSAGVDGVGLGWMARAEAFESTP